MIYEEPFRILWHDTDKKREVRPSAMLTYMQEVANHQFHTNGLPLNELYDNRHMGFLLSRIAIRFHTPVHAYEDIVAQTWTAPSMGISYNRCFRVLRNGETVAEAVSVWALLKTDTGEMIRRKDSPIEFGDEPMISTDIPLRFRIPAEVDLQEVGTRKIAYSDLDFNGHMNNTRYPDMLCNFLPDANHLRVTGMSLSFLKESPDQKTLTILRGQSLNGSTYWFRTVNEAGETCLEAMVLTEPVD